MVKKCAFSRLQSRDLRPLRARWRLRVLAVGLVAADWDTRRRRMWAVIVVLPKAQLEFAVDRAAASVPYTLTMFGFAFGTLTLGRLADRVGIAAPLLISGVCLGVGFVIAGMAPNLAVFSAAHLLLIGVGAGGGFAPMMADISHWFVKRRGLAVVVVASGNYAAGAFWPLVMNETMLQIGWRGTYVAIGLVVGTIVVASSFLMGRRPSARVIADAEEVTRTAREASGSRRAC